LKGYITVDAEEQDSDKKNELLKLLSEMAKGSNIFSLLDEHKKLQEKLKEAYLESEKAFRKYRDENIRYVFKEVKTNKKATTANAEMNDSVQIGRFYGNSGKQEPRRVCFC
jgi:hypothetical protein